MKKEDLLSLLESVGMRPGRGLGQNFMLDGNLPGFIARQGRVVPGDVVLEVGPGFGALTRELLAMGADVAAVEYDRRIAAYLREKMPQEHFRLIEGDACKVDFFAALPQDGPYKAIANLPYAISSVFIARMLESPHKPERMVFLLQKEMAQRLAAGPGTPNYGALSIRTALHYRVELVRTVPPDVFYPKPEVESAVAVFTPAGESHPPVVLKYLPGLVKSVFAQRRKQMGKVLGRLYGAEKVQKAFDQMALPLEIRPEKLTVAQFCQLTELLFQEEKA